MVPLDKSLWIIIRGEGEEPKCGTEIKQTRTGLWKLNGMILLIKIEEPLFWEIYKSTVNCFQKYK